jgi:hypothetical protein
MYCRATDERAGGAASRVEVCIDGMAWYGVRKRVFKPCCLVGLGWAEAD